MGRLAGEFDEQAHRRAGDLALGDGDVREGQARHVVDRERIVRRDRAEFRIAQHGLGAVGGFLGRLEQQHRSPAHGPSPAQNPRHRRHHRHMAVMAAHMCLAVRPRTVRHVRDLLDRQRVEFAAQQHRRPRLRALVDQRHAMPAEIGNRRVGPGVGEEGDHLPRGLDLFARDFRILMQLSPPRLEMRDLLMVEDRIRADHELHPSVVAGEPVAATEADARSKNAFPGTAASRLRV